MSSKPELVEGSRRATTLLGRDAHDFEKQGITYEPAQRAGAVQVLQSVKGDAQEQTSSSLVRDTTFRE